MFENGAGLYDPDGYQFLPHPELTDPSSFRTVRQRLEEELVQTGKAFFQPGKEYTLTLFAHNSAKTDQLHEWAEDALGSLSSSVALVYSTFCLNVLPRGIHKGKGVEFLADRTGYAPADMLGVGDSDVDLPFLAEVGYSASPANANPRIKEIVQYVSPGRTADGVRDIFQYFQLI